MLLDYHEQGDDYLFVFDYHDDLAVLNSETNPTEYHFFQIKSRSAGVWNLKSILKRTTGKGGAKLGSILGKMFMHTKNFPDEVGTLTFVSNSEFKVIEKTKATAQNVTHVCLEDLEKTQTEEIIKSIKEELSPEVVDPEFLKITFLKTHVLSVKESSSHTKGKLSEFLDKRAAGKKYNVESVYKSVFDEVKRKTSFSDTIASFEELKERKGIGKTSFDQILQLIGERKDYDQAWNDVSRHLSDAGVAFGDIMDYKKNWKKIEVERMNPNSRILLDTIKRIRKAMHDLQAANAFAGADLLQSARLVTAALGDSALIPFDNKYLETLVIVELHE